MAKGDAQTGAAAAQESSARWALGALALTMLLPSLGISISGVALPAVSRAFDASFREVQWIVIIYLIATTVTIVGAGRLGDVAGRRRMLSAGLTLFTLGSVLCGIAPTLWMVIAARAVQGLAAAVLMALTVALVHEVAAKERTGRAMGLLGSMSALGTALGPSLAGALLDGPGWRAVFLVMVPLGILNLFLVRRCLPPPVPAALPTNTAGGERFDGTGTLLLGLTLTAYALAVTAGRSFGAVNAILLVAAVSGAGLFALVQARAESPLIPPSVWRDGSLRIGLVTNAVVASVMMATLVVGPFYLSLALGLSESGVGIAMSVGPVVSVLSGAPAGRMVDRRGVRAVVIAGLVILAAGAFGLAVLPERFGLAGYIAAIVVLTPGYQLFLAGNTTAVMRNVPADRRGLVSGVLNLSRQIGLITGASAMGALFAVASGAGDGATAAPEAVGTGIRAVFATAGVLIAAATVAVLRAGAGRPALPDGNR
ncbi:MFS transporter [Azospirillum halopraeferens]|uniref:MFS transporter n=1 Tax=Azospirillum halopraeferens TaxID=34010 RepID=UPI0005541887|nr:MFS transporter [Azospirillum halopraeferens]